MQRPPPLRTDRIRTLERPFGWIPFRILTSGLLPALSPPTKLLYFFLCLVADLIIRPNSRSFLRRSRYDISWKADSRVSCR